MTMGSVLRQEAPVRLVRGWVGLASLGLGLCTDNARLQVRTPHGIEEL